MVVPRRGVRVDNREARPRRDRAERPAGARGVVPVLGVGGARREAILEVLLPLAALVLPPDGHDLRQVLDVPARTTEHVSHHQDRDRGPRAGMANGSPVSRAGLAGLAAQLRCWERMETHLSLIHI